MRSPLFARLSGIARRECGDAASAEDIVQDALIVAVHDGRTQWDDPATARWLSGVVRNKARMLARSAGRRRLREGAWLRERAPASSAEADDAGAVAADLPPSLRVLYALIVSGHNRAEVRWLLGVPDTALRQRLSALRRALRVAGVSMPEGMPGLSLDVAYGRLREALLPQLRRGGGVLASHDPDGHLIFVRTSQSEPSRQPSRQPTSRSS